MPAGDLASPWRKSGYSFAVGDYDLSQQAFSVGGDIVGIEVDQRIASFHCIAQLGLYGEADAFELDGIQTDMHQYFDALRSGDSHSMSGWMQLSDFAVTGGAQTLIERIDGDSITDHLLGKYRVGNAFDRYQGAGEWSNQDYFGGRAWIAGG